MKRSVLIAGAAGLVLTAVLTAAVIGLTGVTRPTTSISPTAAASTAPPQPVDPVDAAWAALPVGRPAGGDAVDEQNVLYTVDGRRIQIQLSSSRHRAVELRKVHSGWLMQSQPPEAGAGRVWWFVTADGSVRPLAGELVDTVIATSPDGKLLAAAVGERLVIYRMPDFGVVAQLDRRQHKIGREIEYGAFVGDRLVFASENLGGEHEPAGVFFGGTQIWHWSTGRLRVLEDFQAIGVTADGSAVFVRERKGSCLWSAGLADLRRRPLGCPRRDDPMGALIGWLPSPDGTRLAALQRRYDRRSADGMPYDAVVSNLVTVGLPGLRPEHRNATSFPGVGRLAWLSDAEILLAVGLAQVGGDYGYVMWGLLRCTADAARCERVPLPTGGFTAPAVDAVLP